MRSLVAFLALSVAIVECRFDRLFRSRRHLLGNSRLDETANSVKYSDAFAREKMMPMAAAAYSDTPQACVTNVLGGTVTRFVETRPFSNDVDVFAGFTAVAPQHKAIILSFRGSDYEQLLTEGYGTIFDKQDPFIIGGKVGDYFYTGFESLWMAGLKDGFATLRSENPDYELWVTGHSLGASMATLAAAWIVKAGAMPLSSVRLVTFGQPRTGNHAFASAHDALMPSAIRVVHRHDLVVHLPPENFENYYHHGTEVWYDNDMQAGCSFKVCSKPEDDTCSNSAFNKFSILDHMTYFGKTLNEYGPAGCV